MMQKRVIFGFLAAALFLPFVMMGGLSFQLVVGALAIIGVSELFKMKGLEVFSFEGLLAMLGAFVLTVPLEYYFTFLPVGGSLSVYTIVVFVLLAATVFGQSSYSFDDVVYPIATSFYVGIGFQNLVLARIASVDKVLLALFIVWSTDIGAYLIGRQFGRRHLAPSVSPNKTVEGSLGGLVAALFVSVLMMLFRPSVYAPYSFVTMMFLVVVFSIFAQFGDLVESALKRHFGVKDSGQFIPGHGGVLDRFDSLIFVFPIMHFFGLF